MLGMVVFWALAAAAPEPAPHSSSPLSPGSPPASIQTGTAEALAETVMPADLFASAQVEQAHKAILLRPSADADSGELEEEYPGIWAAVWVAVEPAMRKSAVEDLPAFRAGLVTLYRSRLTETEGNALLAFYRSPTGHKLLRATMANLDATPALHDMLKSASNQVSAEQMATATDAAKMQAVKQLSNDDLPALFTLLASVKMDKVRALGAEVQKFTLDWVNKDDAEADKQIEALVTKALKQYIASHPSKK